jgi:hypothetical protein
MFCSTLEQLIVRYTKNYMSEKAYFENIKSRKFQALAVFQLCILYLSFRKKVLWEEYGWN